MIALPTLRRLLACAGLGGLLLAGTPALSLAQQDATVSIGVGPMRRAALAPDWTAPNWTAETRPRVRIGPQRRATAAPAMLHPEAWHGVAMATDRPWLPGRSYAESPESLVAALVPPALASVPLPASGLPVPSAVDCSDPALLGTRRVIEVPFAGGTGFGHAQHYPRLPLNPGEFVLTFDDGPSGRYTQPILDALDAQCVKATFFVVGKMTRGSPKLLAETYRRGHSIGTHTHSHPLLTRLAPAAAAQQIDDGFAAANAVLRQQPHNAIIGYAGGAAPFFRFPGLDQDKALLKETAARDLAVFSCDVCTTDWKSMSDDALLQQALGLMQKSGSGIVLLHDIQPKTARVLPRLLAEMKARGFSIVHMVPEGTLANSIATASLR